MPETEQDLVHRHERSDMAPRWPILIGAGMLLLLPLTIALVAGLMNTLWQEPPAAPDMFEGEPRIVNAPHLLVHPEARLEALRAEWQERLSSYGWIDRSKGIVHIPIDNAMARLAAGQSLGQRTQQPTDGNAPGSVREQSRGQTDE